MMNSVTSMTFQSCSDNKPYFNPNKRILLLNLMSTGTALFEAGATGAVAGTLCYGFDYATGNAAVGPRRFGLNGRAANAIASVLSVAGGETLHYFLEDQITSVTGGGFGSLVGPAISAGAQVVVDKVWRAPTTTGASALKGAVIGVSARFATQAIVTGPYRALPM